jgi:hypothetical protein
MRNTLTARGCVAVVVLSLSPSLFLVCRAPPPPAASVATTHNQACALLYCGSGFLVVGPLAHCLCPGAVFWFQLFFLYVSGCSCHCCAALVVWLLTSCHVTTKFVHTSAHITQPLTTTRAQHCLVVHQFCVCVSVWCGCGRQCCSWSGVGSHWFVVHSWLLWWGSRCGSVDCLSIYLSIYLS